MDNWSYSDIPISKFSVVAEPNPINGEIKIITNIAGKIREDYLQTWNDQVRNALITMGWKHPEWVCPTCGGPK